MNKNKINNLTGIVVIVVFFITMMTFFGYYNFNWYPEKNRSVYTIEIHYQSGRNITNLYDLPTGTEFGVYINNHKYGNGNTYLKYNYNKPFGNENGYIAFDVDDYKILKIEPIKE